MSGSECRDTTVLAHTILKIERFIDTMYSSDGYVEQLEKEGKQSDTILLSGKRSHLFWMMALWFC